MATAIPDQGHPIEWLATVEPIQVWMDEANSHPLLIDILLVFMLAVEILPLL